MGQINGIPLAKKTDPYGINKKSHFISSLQKNEPSELRSKRSELCLGVLFVPFLVFLLRWNSIRYWWIPFVMLIYRIATYLLLKPLDKKNIVHRFPPS
jgi:hypothetical protein